MSSKLLKLLLAVSVASSSVSPAFAAAMIPDGNQFFFRYKDVNPTGVKPPDSVSKDITVFYVRAVGDEFSEVLPMKPEWQDDDWRVTKGTLPAGITFDAATRTFYGTPSAVATNHVVELEGFDTAQNSVATASVTFDFIEVSGTPVSVDIFAHTGQYKLAELTIPTGVTVDRWEYLRTAPDGVTVNGPFFEGTPTKAGTYPVLILGLNYSGDTVVTFIGKYVVVDTPEFPDIADNIVDLPNPYYKNAVDFNFGPTPILKSVGDISKVKYALELAEGSDMPGTVKFTSSPAKVIGSVTQPYETATVRWKAIDTDGVEGFSNWFTFGTGNPSPACGSWGNPVPVSFYTGKQHDIQIGQVRGGVGTLSYRLVSGTMPEGLTFVADTGHITGSPTKKQPDAGITVETTVTNGDEAVTAECVYVLKTYNAGFTVSDATAQQSRHVRVGDAYRGTLSITGGLEDFDTAFADAAAWPDYAISTAPTLNASTVEVVGTPKAKGSFSIPLTVTNGDENALTRNLTVNAYGELDFGQAVANVTVKRLEASSVLATMPYDASTVIPDVAKQNMPAFTLGNSAALPAGVNFSTSGTVSGSTTAAAGTYGPFTVTMRDYSGDTTQSNAFNVVVQDREPIEIGSLTAPVFVAEKDAGQTATPVTLVQPPLAKDFDVKYTLTGAAFPTWLSFDNDTGVFSTKSVIPFEDIGTYGPFTLTATDEDGSTVTSDEFNVEVKDWPDPDSGLVATVRGTVSGDTSLGQTQTTVVKGNLTSHIFEETVIGGRSAVKFLSAEPECPAGVCFDAANGIFSGRPTAEFNGDVIVTFEDGKKRQGTITIPMDVRAYPSIAMPAATYDLPRLSSAVDAGITAQQVAGFWNAPTWAIDTSRGTDIAPYGLSVDTNGAIAGKTSDASGTTINNIVLKATSAGANGETLVSWTQPFSITVGDPVPMILGYTPSTQTFFMKREADGSYSYVNQTAAAPKASGSFVAPLTYSMADRADALAAGFPAAVDLDVATGRFVGTPSKLGDWTVSATVKDKEGRSPETNPQIRVLSTLSGAIERSNGGGSQVLRVGEPFKTEALAISNEVRPVVFTATPSTIPASVMLGFDPTTGEFNDQATFETATNSYLIDVSVKDAHGRGFKTTAPRYGFQVIRPLEMSVAAANQAISSKQYDVASTINASFAPTITYTMGKISYGMSGDIPGTLVNRTYDKAGAFLGWSWTDASGTFQTLPASTPENALKDLLPLDALVFDTKAATLTGIPSRAGTFTASLTAYDDHADDYIRNVASKVGNNSASVPVTFTVTAADPLLVSNSAATVTVAQFTDTPSIIHTATGGAYGRGVTWTTVGSDLPEGITGNEKDLTVGYSGYAETRGTFGGIVWQAKDAAKRTAPSDPVTIVVGPQAALAVANNLTTETVPQYTGQPKMTHTVTGAPYGKGVTWTMLSGTVPSNVTANKGASALTYSGYPDTRGTYDNIVWRATDAKGRTVDTTAVAITVGARLPLQLEATYHPPIYVIDKPISDNAVTAKNVADGLTIPKEDWTLTAAQGLPTGIVASIEDGRIVFSGTPTQTGPWTATISTKDSRGGTATLSMPFDIIPTDNPIGLEVANIKTKAGYPFEMQSKSSNTYGTVRFYSQDISGDLATQLHLDGGNGLVSGSFSTIGNRDFDVFVTDSTNRITSKPVVAEVMPDLRVTVPAIVQTQQATTLNRTVATDYVLGTVSYEKGAGAWPEGFAVNPTTGEITAVDTSTGTATNRVIAASGSYPDLTIRAVDTFQVSGVTYTDRQESNSFTISIAAADVIPDIKDPTGLKVVLGTQNTPMAAAWKPTVHEKGTTKVYAFAGTRYTPSHDLTQYGLSFDTATGAISGTAHTPFIIRDFTITVQSQRGDTDTTSKFWIGMAPQGNITPKAGQKDTYVFRVDGPFVTDAPLFDNFIGNGTFALPAGKGPNAFDTTTGVYSSTKLVASQKGSWVTTVTVVDEFGRNGSFVYTLNVVDALVATVPSSAVSIALGKDIAGLQPVTLTGLVGSSSFTATGLPTGLDVSPTTGAISGKIDAKIDPVQVTVVATDSADGQMARVSYTVYTDVDGPHLYWRVSDRNPNTGTGCDRAYPGSTLHFSQTAWTDTAGTDVTGLMVQGKLSTLRYDPNPTQISATGNGYDTVKPDANGIYYKAYKFSSPVDIAKVGLYDASTFSACGVRSPSVDYSDDGVNWFPKWNIAQLGAVKGWVYIIKP